MITLIELTDRVLARHLCVYGCENWAVISYDGEPCCEDCYDQAKRWEMREL